MRVLRSVLAVSALFMLTGCWNGENVNVRLGDGSIGQQLIDLQRAEQEGAITEDEHKRIKQLVLAPLEVSEEAEETEEESFWF